MSRKKTLNLTVPAELLDEFDAVCSHYGHAKQKGMVLSAAILMFLRSDPAAQGQCLKQIAVADIEAGVEALIEQVKKEQGLRVAMQDATRRADALAVDPASSSSRSTTARPRTAAKKATTSKRRVTKLASLDQLKGRRRKR